MEILVGVDVVEVERFREVLLRRPRILERLFCVSERRWAATLSDPVPSLAARFAAKEAVMKVLGKGVGAVRFQDIEIVRSRDGRPVVVLHGSAEVRAGQLGVARVDCSLSHSASVAIAQASALSLVEPGPDELVWGVKGEFD
jgi:holo-[acyl-carrier protein] synthase